MYCILIAITEDHGDIFGTLGAIVATLVRPVHTRDIPQSTLAKPRIRARQSDLCA